MFPFRDILRTINKQLHLNMMKVNNIECRSHFELFGLIYFIFVNKKTISLYFFNDWFY
ncbi:hypothetical protein XSR1_300044 [Xenorhabdus szentirmaii DSM 16338]|uniref:Uncharacterized protein n=1 Tax=Xenorhabdus szentirmaii DSM 16338 TaxID=1427518 RepID=W1IYC6_9GAMM|nr:hypothetical protein XSR1_300044 [Xenorhabdus szentirmaii DSM 16338]